MQITSNSANQTRDYAEVIAGQLSGGEVLCLMGDLGAGKTAFTGGLARGLGIGDAVNSPTFVIMQQYDFQKSGKKMRLYHMDAYRMASSQEALDLGLVEIWNDESAIMVIEWADMIADILPDERLEIRIAHLGENKRKWQITGFGKRHQALEKKLTKILS